MSQVQSVNDKFAWVCALDEEHMIAGCVKKPISRVLKLCQKYELNAVANANQARNQAKGASQTVNRVGEPTDEHKEMVLALYRQHQSLRRRKVIDPCTGRVYGLKGIPRCCRDIEDKFNLRPRSISQTTIGYW